MRKERRDEKLKKLLEQYHALEDGDHRWFQPRARLLQSLWRDDHGYAAFRDGDRIFGAWLAMPWAEESLANYLTKNIRDVARREVANAAAGQLFQPPRIWNNLLSSQPLCFNLFAELRLDLSLASELVRTMTDGRMTEVTEVKFEYSPGRGDPKFTGDSSAFDVFLATRTSKGLKGFLGIEVKYHENLQDKLATHKPRYDEVAASMGCFDDEHVDELRRKPLQQVWRDHLLGGALADVEGYSDWAFVYLHPANNEYCAEGVAAYEKCLSDETTFLSWTLENVHAALAALSEAEWIRLFYERYLDFGRIELAS